MLPIDERIEKFILERLDIILQETYSKQDKNLLQQGENLLANLPKAQRDVIQEYIALCIGEEEIRNKQAYLGGFEDAVWLLVRLAILFLQHETDRNGQS